MEYTAYALWAVYKKGEPYHAVCRYRNKETATKEMREGLESGRFYRAELRKRIGHTSYNESSLTICRGI
jgi:hypothetical protein